MLSRRRVVEAAQKGTSHTSLESVGEFTHSVAPQTKGGTPWQLWGIGISEESNPCLVSAGSIKPVMPTPITIGLPNRRAA